MKINEVKITAQNSQKSNNNRTKPISFSGFTDGLVNFWEGVDRGGLAASFTIQDMLGTNIPRTWAAKDVGKDITGKNNWGAVLENGLREFITGPSMFVVPWIVLALSTKFGGKANQVSVQTIKDFAEIIQNSGISINDKNDINAFKRSFYKSVLERVFSNFDNSEVAHNGVDLDGYVRDILKMESSKGKGFINNIKNVPVPDSKEDILAEIVKRFVADKKANTQGYTDFLKTLITDKRYIKDANKIGKYEIKIDDLIGRMIKYSDDIFNSFAKSTDSFDDFLRDITKRRMGSRFATNIAMGLFTAASMWVIPKIYTVNKTNPETDPVRQKASELKNSKSSDVSFNGGGISRLMSNLGDKVNPGQSNWLSKNAGSLESNRINVARPIFYVLITGFTLIPRLLQSTKRDIESSKKNGGPVQWDETSNILRRDITTILTILFAMEGMGSFMAHQASKNKGVILTTEMLNKKDSFFKKFIKIFNPDGGVQVLSKAQNTAQMSNFANLDQFMRYLENTQENGGNIYKLLHIDANDKKAGSLLYNAAKKVFGNIIDNKDLNYSMLFASLTENPPLQENIDVLLGVLNDTTKNPLLKLANKINAIFQTVSLAIVTGFLGFGLPKINDFIIKRKYLKDDGTLQPKYNDPNMPIPAYSILKNLDLTERQTFQYFLGNLK